MRDSRPATILAMKVRMRGVKIVAEAAVALCSVPQVMAAGFLEGRTWKGDSRGKESGGKSLKRMRGEARRTEDPVLVQVTASTRTGKGPRVATREAVISTICSSESTSEAEASKERSGSSLLL